MIERIAESTDIIELGHVYHSEIPHHHSHNPFIYSMSRMHGDTTYDGGVTTANDLITTGTHTGTHIDALGHVACNGYLFNDVPVNQNQSKTKGLSIHGVEEIKPIITNAKLLDIPRAKNMDTLEYSYKISSLDIKETIQKQEISINKGDAVFIRTGWGACFCNPIEFISQKNGAPGMSIEAVDFLLEEFDISLTGSDNTAYEIIEGNSLPVHQKLLVEKGIHIIEMMNLEEISDRKIFEFTFICLPLRILGATGSPVRPIAII